MAQWYLVISEDSDGDSNSREYYCDDMAHAKEQHMESVPDEKFIGAVTVKQRKK